MARACARSDITPERVVMRRNLRNTHELSIGAKETKTEMEDERKDSITYTQTQCWLLEWTADLAAQ